MANVGYARVSTADQDAALQHDLHAVLINLSSVYRGRGQLAEARDYCRKDIALMEQLGVNAYRFSISWSRLVTPDGHINPAGRDYYRALSAELSARGVTPWATKR